MSKRFRVYYRHSGDDMEHCQRLECASPITALNQFHRLMQLVDGWAPSGYSIVRLCEVYTADAFGRNVTNMIESDYDLPNAPNPDCVSVKREVTECQSAMESILKEAESKS